MNTFLLLLDGMTGAGKTTTTKLLAKDLPRTAIIGMDKVKWFLTDFERGTRDNDISKEVTLQMTKKYLELGISVIIEQPFKSIEEIQEYEEIARAYSVPCYKFQLFTTPEIAHHRITERQKDSENKLPEERIQRNISLFKKRDELGFTIIDTSTLNKEEVAQQVLRGMQS